MSHQDKQQRGRVAVLLVCWVQTNFAQVDKGIMEITLKWGYTRKTRMQGLS